MQTADASVLYITSVLITFTTTNTSSRSLLDYRSMASRCHLVRVCLVRSLKVSAVKPSGVPWEIFLNKRLMSLSLGVCEEIFSTTMAIGALPQLWWPCSWVFLVAGKSWERVLWICKSCKWLKYDQSRSIFRGELSKKHYNQNLSSA